LSIAGQSSITLSKPSTTGPSTLSFLRLRQGRPGRLPSPEDAAAYQYTDIEKAFVEQRWTGQALGSPETVTGQLSALLERTAADELMLTTMVYDRTARIHSYERIRASTS
jgi:alkanesulfonate monooxygenase SsuD/methylene tetrahydromethanopterin reductase-like flavin-dependent oxidoreductase (luciferase family)